MKTLRMVQMLLQGYLSSGRFLLELGLVAAAGVLVRLGAPSAAVATLVMGVVALALAILVTYRITGWVNHNLGYMLIVRPLGREGYLLGTVLASWLLVVALYLALRLATWPRLGAAPLDLVRTSLPMVLALSLVVVVTAFLSPLVAGSEWVRTGFLVLLALSVYRDDLGQWNELFRMVLQVFWMTFAVPVLGGLNLSANWGYSVPALWLLGLTAVETILILGAALVFFVQRDLDWD
ncbi:MAG: hypothetical protein M1370_03455 [Bacteroidetes bacterium]|nr:hypothetical protein [Bacteroidota bacterium]